MRIDEIISLAKEESRKTVEAGEEVEPTILARTPAGPVPILLAQLNKDTFRQDLARLLRLLRADAYVFICTGWMAEGNASKRALKEGRAISELPLDDRAEIIFITAYENGGAQVGYFAKIQTARGERRLSEWQRLEGTPNGRMVLTRW